MLMVLNLICGEETLKKRFWRDTMILAYIWSDKIEHTWNEHMKKHIRNLWIRSYRKSQIKDVPYIFGTQKWPLLTPWYDYPRTKAIFVSKRFQRECRTFLIANIKSNCIMLSFHQNHAVDKTLFNSFTQFCHLKYQELNGFLILIRKRSKCKEWLCLGCLSFKL